MKIVLNLIAVVFLLSGCVSMAKFDPAKQEEAQRTMPSCMTDRECEMQWAAARKWVMNNAAYKLKIVTSDYLETYPATGGSPRISARVTKEPMKTGGYNILVAVWCDNIFGCVPDAWDAAIAFNKEVGGAASSSASAAQATELK